MPNLKENQIDDVEFLKFLQDNKDQETQIQIRLFDNKNNKVAYKNLTIKELLLVEASVNIEWHKLPRRKWKINE